MPTIALILVAACINTAAQLLLKAGANRVSFVGFDHWRTLIGSTFQVAFNPFIMVGLSCYVASVVIWILVLSRVQVSVAYPLMSLAYVTTTIAAAILFHEPVTMTRMGGILVIILGVYLITRS